MNKQPVSYLQTDPKWADRDYSAAGESTTIGKSGCGPACAAMLIETITGKTFTPADACAWALKKGYKAPNQGTYYSYFVPQFHAHGIQCQRINGVSIYGSKTAAAHKDAFALLEQGWYLIACMGKGNWTSSGHFVVVWWEDGWVRINDPASTATSRVKGNLNTFKSQVKYYWAVDAREHNTACKGTDTPHRGAADAPQKDELAEAVDKLHKAGVINSPDYWKRGKGYSDANVAALIKKAATLCK